MLQVAERLDVPRPRPAIYWRLLSGPGHEHGAESLEEHVRRLGPRPKGGRLLINELDVSGLRGRGGAGFPAGRKWASIANAPPGDRVVAVNLAEGEPASFKDRVLAAMRPHLIVDGAVLAAETLRARRIVIYLAHEHDAARQAIKRALGERRRAGYREPRVDIVECPDKYVAGESSALVHRVNGGAALPTLTPPSPREVGIDGVPTLINNAETIAHVALIARFGAAWFRTAGTPDSPGTALLTIGGAVLRPGVIEVDRSVTIGDVIDASGGLTGAVDAILLGGYFGTWLAADSAWRLSLDDASLTARKTSLGCGVLLLLPAASCGLLESARILRYLAAESAGQCGPCIFGLQSIAETVERIAAGTSSAEDVFWLRRWAGQISGRGACHHPDGAIRLLLSALAVFHVDIQRHANSGTCNGVQHPSILPMIGAHA